MRQKLPIPIMIAFASIVFSTIVFSAGKAPLISLTVDATEAPRKIFHATMTVPVQPGPLTLLYPKWIPGEHGPSGPVVELTGLKLHAAGKDIPWKRDLLDPFTFHCVVPAGATTLEVSLDYLSPSEVEGFSGGASATSNLAVISWHQLLLYPQGWSDTELKCDPKLKLPDGWKHGSALVVAKESDNIVHYKQVSLNTLVDSPVITGRHFRKVDISIDSVPHQMNLAGDTESSIAISSELIQQHKRLVAEANALFGAHHYEKYDFLYAFSDFIASFGLEHHESSDNRVAERTLSDPDLWRSSADLLPHEMVHSWNGKYRRPANLTTPDPQAPMQTDLLWIYEGLTQYLGVVLAARSGLWTAEDFRENLAWVAAYLDKRSGRSWRPLVDTAVFAHHLYGARSEWADWRRRVDFYNEMILVWL
ncbi:MAG TPA: M61 family peptidase, partial [Acidobacteriota bacterium]|nr:M61 family peptidase [Acidobacteriota bacterium]